MWACWVFNPSYPLCHFFLHFTYNHTHEKQMPSETFFFQTGICFFAFKAATEQAYLLNKRQAAFTAVSIKPSPNQRNSSRKATTSPIIISAGRGARSAKAAKSARRPVCTLCLAKVPLDDHRHRRVGGAAVCHQLRRDFAGLHRAHINHQRLFAARQRLPLQTIAVRGRQWPVIKSAVCA